jgi:hypothetical protein
VGAPAGRRFRFAQWEFPGRLGPAPGRYVLRRFAGDDIRHVVVLAELEAPQTPRGGRLRRLRGVHAAPEPQAAGAPVTRATVIDATPLASEAAARGWLIQAGASDLAEALAVLNRVLHRHRLAAADPLARELGAAHAMVARLGYGVGEQVAEGRWEAAIELPVPARPAARTALPAQDRLTALLAGRDAPLACEELALRARADLDHGRDREAAMQLAAALDAALAELASWREERDLAARLDELAGCREAVHAAARAAREGGLEPPAQAAGA